MLSEGQKILRCKRNAVRLPSSRKELTSSWALRQSHVRPVSSNRVGSEIAFLARSKECGMSKHVRLLLAATLLLSFARPAVATPPGKQDARPNVEVVFCLDTTGSMTGLIDAAKK